MRQERFVAKHGDEWTRFDAFLGAWRRDHRAALVSLHPDAFMRRYRTLCQQLALARQRGYSSRVVDRLQDLVQGGHQVLYRGAPFTWREIGAFLAHGFPRLVRAERRAVACAAALFFVPLLAMAWLTHARPELIHSVFDAAQVASYEQMYDPARAKAGLGREQGGDAMMFGFYILNNISIGFRCFASGLLFGVAPVFLLVLNGVMIGALAGYLVANGSAVPFLSFTAGHGAPELLAIVICGAAGLRLGFALIAPGPRRRRDALVEAGRVGGALVAGGFAMLLLAAFIEAFWSASLFVPPVVKYAVGGAMWLLTLGWLALAGRR